MCLREVVPLAFFVDFHMHNYRSTRVVAGAHLSMLTRKDHPSMTDMKKKKGLERVLRKKVDMLDNNNTGTPPASYAPVPSCHVMRKTRSKPRQRARHEAHIQEHCGRFNRYCLYHGCDDVNNWIKFQSQIKKSFTKCVLWLWINN